MITQLTYNKENDTYEAISGYTFIQIKRDSFDKAMRAQIKEYIKGGIPEIPEAYTMAKERMLIAEYWISSQMDGVNITEIMKD